jgi:hypothetical protein
METEGAPRVANPRWSALPGWGSASRKSLSTARVFPGSFSVLTCQPSPVFQPSQTFSTVASDPPISA